METSSNNLKKKAFSGVFWTLGERIGAQMVSMIVSIVLARILMAEDYAPVSVVSIFFNFATVFVTSGLNSALIQKKDSTITDYSTILYTSLGAAAVVYVILFFTAPFIAAIYELPILIPLIRVMALSLIINAVKSILSAFISNTLQFKKLFISTVVGTVISAVVGIAMALNGFGAWALVAQQMTNAVVSTISLFITTKFVPRLTFSIKSFKELFGYGWKIFVASIISEIYNELNPLIVGLKFSSLDLSFYSKGHSFPVLLNGTITNTLSTVLFPVVSKVQNDLSAVLSITRRYIRVTTYVVFPIMCGFFAVSESFVKLILTEKWLPTVPYIQIFCISFMFNIIQTANLLSIKAIGRSDISLILEIIKKASYFAIIAAFVFLSDSPIMLAISSIACTVVATVVNTFPNRKLIGYKYRYQLSDILPNLIISTIMLVVVLFMNKLPLPTAALFVLQIVAGAVVYVVLSIITKNENFKYLLNTAKQVIRKEA